MDLAGRAAIEAHAERLRVEGVSARLTLGTVVDGGGPAIYLYWSDGWVTALGEEFEARLVVTADDGTGCPGDMAVSLRIADGLIAEERRFHAVESVRRCWATDELPSGWWAGLRPPPLLHDEVTGTVRASRQQIEIRNGSPGLEQLVTWAMERFETGGLPPPPVASVAFNANVHGVPCSERNGLTLDLGDTAKVFLCSGQTEMCQDDACT